MWKQMTWQEYQGAFPKAREIDYDHYCFDLYTNWIESQLTKHAERNYSFLKLWPGDLQAYKWLSDYITEMPSSCSSKEVGKTVFENHISLMGIYNSLILRLANDEFDEIEIAQYLDSAKAIKFKNQFINNN